MSVRARWLGLAVTVAVVLGAGWLVFLRPQVGGRGPVGFGATGPMSVWPESPFDPADALREEQARVDAGRHRWRLDGEEVVTRFAQSVLGWVAIEVGDGGSPTGGGPATFRVRPVCDGCDDRDGWIGVTVDRLLGGRSIWSVVGVTSPRLRLPVEAGDTVVAGDLLGFELDLSDGRHAAVGLRYLQRIGAPGTDCGDRFAGEAGVTATEASVSVPDPLFDRRTCPAFGIAGYVFAYTTPELTVQTGDPMLEPAFVEDLAIVPVLVAPEPVEPSP
jgi:hypothetical protein